MRRVARLALWVAPLIAIAFAAAPARAQIPPTGVGSATVVPIQVTGPPANRFNLVIAGDGYTESEQDKFMQQVDKHLNVMWSIEPYKSYRNYINVYAIKIISGDSGISCDPNLTSARKTTPLSMAFWGGCSAASVQRLISVNNTKLAQYTALAPGVSQRLAIANSDTYGGAGGANATASGGNSLSALISPHEIGHSLGGLQDEYDYYQRGVLGGCYTGGEPTSVHHTLLTIDQMLSQQKKWWRWLGEPSEAGGLIGRYEGGMYFDKCVWRPSQHSIMKTLGFYYDQVSREVMTQRISSRVKLVDASTPTTTQPGRTDTVWVETQHPVDHELDVTWAVDGGQPDHRQRALARPVDAQPGGRHAHADRHRRGSHDVRARPGDPQRHGADSEADVDDQGRRQRPGDGDAGDHPLPLHREAGRPQRRRVRGDHAPRRAGHLDARRRDGRRRGEEPAPVEPEHRPRLAHAGGEVGDDTRTWKVDATEPVTTYAVSPPRAVISQPGADAPEYIFEGPFSMKLTATDDDPGYAAPEFRVDGDGWQNFYGWPTDAGAPFQFSVTGTDIDLLNYGKLAYGKHVIEYRAIDAAGNVATAKRFIAELHRPGEERGRRRRRHGARDAVALARRARELRRVHPRPGQGLRRRAGRRRGEHGRERGAERGGSGRDRPAGERRVLPAGRAAGEGVEPARHRRGARTARERAHLLRRRRATTR